MPECFTILADEVEKRIDPHFYRPAFIRFYHQLEKTKFEIKSVGEISEKVTSGATPLSKGDAYTSKEEGIPFVRSGDINEDKNINFDEVLYIKENIHNKILKGSKLKKGDVLIAIVGATIGQVSIYDYDKEANINQAIALVRLNQGINPEYVKAFMISTLGQKQLDRIKRPVARANINLDEIRSIRIILPSLAIQNKIVSLMDNAYEEQKNKEEKTTEFLDSINDYVLDELGIKLSKSENRMYFVVNFDDVKTGRIDPVSFAHPQDTPSSDKFEEKLLGEVASLAKGQSITKDNITSGDYPVIAGGQSSPYSIDRINHKGNVVTVSASGAYSGYIWYHDYPIFASDCTVIKSLDEKDISTFYLYCVMKAKQKFIYNMQQGAGQPHVYSRDLSKLKIPLPLLSVQNKIADEVKNRMQRAEQLQKQAKEELKKAKMEVEKIILG